MTTATRTKPAVQHRGRSESNEDSHSTCTGKQQRQESANSANGDQASEKRCSDKLVELALERYRIGQSRSNEPFAVEKNGPNIAIMLRSTKDSIRSVLASEYWRVYGAAANGAALTDALAVLQGMAINASAEQVYLRVAEHNDCIVLDLGDETGRAVIVDRGQWRIVDRSPVLFRRTRLTGAIPTPDRSGELDDLRQLLDVTDETWPLLFGWIVSAFIPSIPHPILLLGGSSGAGKTTLAKMVIGLINPSPKNEEESDLPAAMMSQPSNEEQWAINAASTWAFAVDNVSKIPQWWSDALCKAVTGERYIRRKLYSDDDQTVLAFRRVMMLTSIDAGALRGDLGDRVLTIDCKPIEEKNRKRESLIIQEYINALPRSLGALLNLLANVWKELPNTHPQRLPRMADFGCVLAAMDKVLVTSSLDSYFGHRRRVAADVVHADPVAIAIMEFMEVREEWKGTAKELLSKLELKHGAQQNWPRTPNILGKRISEVITPLKEIGIRVDRPEDQRTSNYRPLIISKVDCGAATTETESSVPPRKRNNDDVPW